MNLKYPEDDNEFSEGTVGEVRPGEFQSLEEHWWFGLPEGFKAKSGEKYRCYGRGLGSPVRGLFIGGRKAFYQTPGEFRESERRKAEEFDRRKRVEFEENRAELDARYNALPEVFCRRVDKFRTNNPDFRWKYEPYELFCCEEAVKIANAFKDAPAAFETWAKAPYEEQKKVVPDLSDGHSGNTLGMACRLAYLYLVQSEGVVKLHGCLAPLVGSKEYGCVPSEEVEELE